MLPSRAPSSRTRRLAACQLACWVVVLAGGCKSVHTPGSSVSPLAPSNNRDWRPEFEKLPHAKIRGSEVEISNVRNCSYLTEDIYVVDHYDKTVELEQLESVDFIVVPFKTAPTLAHTLLSFGIRTPDGTDYLAVSVEARLENGESYSPLKGASRQYELMYVVADERDVLRLRTEHRDVEVYVYRVRAEPERVRALFVDVMERVNQLERHPEFYDTLANNCTNNIVRHINHLRSGRVPWDPRVLLSGLSDQLAYDLGLLDTSISFAELKERSHINETAHQVADRPDFSDAIRR